VNQQAIVCRRESNQRQLRALRVRSLVDRPGAVLWRGQTCTLRCVCWSHACVSLDTGEVRYVQADEVEPAGA
jgi:hypothetical protein